MTTTTRKTTTTRSEGQQAHCRAFGLIAKLSSDLKIAHEIGLHKESLKHRKEEKRRRTTFSCFKHLNRNCYNAAGIDYPHVVVSKGHLAMPDITSVRLDDDGTLVLTFSNRFYSGDPDDEFILAAYCPRLRACILADPVPRIAEAITTQLPAGWLADGNDIHLYAFFLGKKLFTSDSVYVPIPGRQSDLINTAPDPIKAVVDPINASRDPIKGAVDPINNPTNTAVDPIKIAVDPISTPAKTAVDPINLDPITAKLFQVIQGDGTLTYAGYAQRLGISEATVKRRLQSLKAQGLILRRGSNKTGHWELPA